MKLYCHPISLIPWRIHIALHEKELEFEEVHVDVNASAPRDPAFLRLNPFGQIPVLEDDGFVVAESLAILEYLDEKAPKPALMPIGLEARARTRQLMCWSADYWMSGWKSWIGGKMEAADGSSALALQGRSTLAAHLDVLEGQLGEAVGREWLVDDFSLADVCYAPLVLLLGPAGLGDEVSIRPLVAGWIARLRGRSSVEAAMGAMLGK